MINTEEVTREQCLDACKKTALSYLDAGRPAEAVRAMLVDLARHKQTADAVNDLIVITGLDIAKSGDRRHAREFIEGFN